MEKIKIARAMIKYGGSFVSALGVALIGADVHNTYKIKNAFPEYWEKYSEIARRE